MTLADQTNDPSEHLNHFTMATLPLTPLTMAVLAVVHCLDHTIAGAQTHEPGARGGGGGYVIPVVVHIIHDHGAENISEAQVEDAMRILNEDFNRSNPEWLSVNPAFLGIVADAEITFELAKRDPEGICTNGITRTESTLTNDGTDVMKELILWPPHQYLNIWVCRNITFNAVGYAMTPILAEMNPAVDGIVLLHSYLGSMGTSQPSRARTLTRMAGLWLGLYWIWGPGGSAGAAGNCDQDDDVVDTPNTLGWETCLANPVTCGTLDNVENFMDWSTCPKMFTEGQRDRMHATLESPIGDRDQLSTPSNLAATGVDNPGTICAARFIASARSICAGGTVTFTDESYHAVATRLWEFPGGVPATSTEPTPTVSYAQPGTYAVTLTVGDGSGSLSTVSSSAVIVAPDPGEAPPLVEGFEQLDDLDAGPWHITGSDDNAFGISTVAAFSGDRSVRLQNGPAFSGRFDELISPTMDMSGATQIGITYRYAYARRTIANNDLLRIFASGDCGSTWVLRATLSASGALNTGGLVPDADYVPTTEWALGTVNNITSSFHTAQFRVRFQFESGGGNHFFLDDINITASPVGLDEFDGSAAHALSVVPNPVSANASVLVGQGRAGQVRLAVHDLLGRHVSTLHEGYMPADHWSVPFPVHDLAPGVYTVVLSAPDRRTSTRFVRE